MPLEPDSNIADMRVERVGMGLWAESDLGKGRPTLGPDSAAVRQPKPKSRIAIQINHACNLDWFVHQLQSYPERIVLNMLLIGAMLGLSYVDPPDVPRNLRLIQRIILLLYANASFP